MARSLLARAPTPRSLRSALALATLSACGALAGPAAGAPVSAANWDSAQQRQAVSAGLMEGAGGAFKGAAALTASQANQAMAALAVRLREDAPEQPALAGEEEPAVPAGAAAAPAEPAPAPVTPPPLAHTSQNPVRVTTFDRMVVEQLGLGEVAAEVQARTAAAGLRPPPYFGTEVLARMLELRFEHPVGAQRLDLFPGQPITRAEAAWSLAGLLHLSSWSIESAREAFSSYELPAMSGAQRRALRIAVSRIGYPYVWGGTTDNTADGLEHGGFDCSGFAWRVFKVSGLPWGKRIRGRTAAQQAGEIPRSQRLRIGQLRPGDLLFFGSAHFNSRATEANVIHEGIYLGGNWVIHSSGQGVYVLPLSGSWLGSSFAWGRRVIG